jgi:sigma-B regulation protein RsbU (phosphoserine phosphatase)
LNTVLEKDFPMIDKGEPKSKTIEKVLEHSKENVATTYSDSNLSWAKEHIEKDQARLRTVLDSLPYPFYVIDASNYKIIAANSAAQFGRLSDSSTCYRLTHNSDRPCSSNMHPCPLETIKKTKRPTTVEHLHFDKEKKPMNVEIHAFPIFDKEENVSHIIEYVIDITERKQAEENLKWQLKVNSDLSELYLSIISPKASIETIARSILEKSKRLTGSKHGYVSSIDPKTGDNVAHTHTEMLRGQCKVSEENKKIVFPRGKDGLFPALWGYSLNTGEPFYTNSPEKHHASTGTPEGHIPIHSFLSAPVMLGDLLVGQIALADKDGDYTERELKAICRFSEFYALAIQRYRAEEDLRYSEERFRHIAESAEEWIWEVDANGLYTYASPMVEKILGWKPQEIVGKKYFYDFFEPHSREQLKKAAFKFFSRKEPFKNFSNLNLHRNGEVVILETSGMPILDQIGNLIGYRGADIDVTERKLAEEELKKAHKELNDDLFEAENYVKSILPPPVTEGPVKVCWRYIPSAKLGGDAFGYRWLDNEYFAIYLLDVCGHGVGSALLSVSVLNALNSNNLSYANLKNPAQVLKSLNMTFPSEKHNDMFFSIWYGVYHTRSRNLVYSSAGHPPALIFSSPQKRGVNMTRLRTPNYPIGVFSDISFKQDTHYVDFRSALYLFSDGIYEIIRQDGNMWRLDEFEKLIANLHEQGRNIIDNLYNCTLSISKEESFEDDYTLLNANFP